MKTRSIKLLTLDAKATQLNIKNKFGSLQQYVLKQLKGKVPPTTVRHYMNTGNVNTIKAQQVLRWMERDGVLVELNQEVLDEAA